MTNVFAVVGENRDDPDQLLLLGTDGQHYAYQVPDATTTPIELDDHWVVEATAATMDEWVD